MRIRAQQLLKVEDYPDQKDWIGRLILPINDFLNQAIRILNDGIQFPDNFIGEDHVFSFTYQSESISLPQQFKWTKAAQPGALTIVSATENNVAFAPLVAWDYTTAGLVRLTQVFKVVNTTVQFVDTATTTVSGWPANTVTVRRLTATNKYVLKARITP